MNDAIARVSLAGAWRVRLANGQVDEAMLPGTLDENELGEKEKEGIDSRLTRVRTLEGPAAFTRRVCLSCGEGGRLFAVVERARALSLTVDGMPVPARTGSLSTPWTFEVTRFADGLEHELTFVSDNSYPGMPRDEIVYSSAATDETQTNWNGLLGEISLVEQPAVFACGLRLLCDKKGARVCVTLDAANRAHVRVRVHSPALTEDITAEWDVPAGISEVWLDAQVNPAAQRWDEMEGHTHPIEVAVEGCGTWRGACGVRTFGANPAGRLTLNGRVFFLRGEANCCVFPETGHPPMDVAGWREALQTYASYGVNCMRFHSHCPPEAAFEAADELGMMMQPELSHWDPCHAFESQASFETYRHEMEEIIRVYGNHPSFVMLSLGNELHANEQGVARMNALVREAREMDPTRLYAWGSNNFYGQRMPGPESGFFTAMACGEHMLRATSSNMVGPLNNEPPCTDYNFDAATQKARETWAGPIIGFEVGQYEVLPDFDEIASFRGVTRGVNYQIVRDRVIARGLADEWKRQVEATGEMSLRCYREEVEAALRTRDMSGLSLLGLQDFPGQGTALVGMLNAHLQPKPFDFAKPQRFRAFFRPVLPMALLPARCFSRRDTLVLRLGLANYGKEALGGKLKWTLSGDGQTLTGETVRDAWPQGELALAEEITVPLFIWTHAAALTLMLEAGDAQNTYDLWVYPDEPVQRPAGVLVTASLEEALLAARRGGRVLLSPPATKEAIPGSITSQFSPDFWSVGNFPEQEGAMGCMIRAEHPMLQDFPTPTFGTWPWWQMSRGRAMLVPGRLRPIVKVLDCYKFLRPLALLAECRVGAGRMMISGMGLMEHQDQVEVRALTGAMLAYMAGESFNPEDEMTEEELRAIFAPASPKEDAQ